MADEIEKNELMIRKEKGLVTANIQQPVCNENSEILIASSFEPITSKLVSQPMDLNVSNSNEPIKCKDDNNVAGPSNVNQTGNIQSSTHGLDEGGWYLMHIIY